ncbi:hypothetical protein XA68_11096 [Ophiocordyceps unilateralis]|uniref:RRM domain-containing protein n=1 Tax=Ophiocordyceps unilateralis TaxID=268505 RepID=A0A2A9PGL4_OPHUN|nr:hypothetical protein XA68_11096 [Ophiocordyceps unilateralis]
MSRFMLASFRRQFTTGRALFQQDYQCRVFVGSLPWACDKTQLRESFEKFGPVADVNIVTDPHSGRSRGFGFIQFEDVAHAEKAISDGNGMDMDGRSLLVQPCNLPKNRDQA